MDERKLELKVGALLAATVLAVIALLWAMGELDVRSGEDLRVVFSHTGNVVRGAPVKLGGIKVGEVKRIVLAAERRDEAGRPLPVEMELEVDKAAKGALRADAAVTVSTQGPLGESYLELSPGSKDAPPLPDGEAIRGLDAPRLDLVANRLSAFLEAATRMLDNNPDAFAALVTSVSRLSLTLDSVLSENRGDVRVIASELAQSARNLRIVADSSRALLEPGGEVHQVVRDAAAVTQTLKRDMTPILKGVANLTTQITPEDGQRLKAALDRYTEAATRLDAVATRAERMIARIEAGEGTIGGFYKDPQVYRDVKEIASDLKKHPWKVLWKD